MGKRRLTRQQAWRIERIQQERRERARRRRARGEAVLAGGALGPEQPGTIVAHFGTQVAVEGPDGIVQRCHLRANLEDLVTGDRVVWCAGDSTGVVVAREPRRSELKRPDPHGGLRPVAANVDQVMIVIAPLPEPHANLIDRYLVAAEVSGIEPVILLNKVDLLHQGAGAGAAVEDLLSIYPGLGYRVLRSSTREGGLESLRQALAGRTSVFVGQSGVGKSSLVNALLPRAALRVGELSGPAGKGTHTTSTARLFHLPGGGSLIDSPGIREFGLWHMTRAEVEQGFVEFRPCLGGCRFRDCRHRGEPGCAILAAVEAGAISPRRLESYRHIVTTLED